MVQSYKLGAHSIVPSALATLGVSGSKKGLSMASLGLFGASSPGPGPGQNSLDVRPMLLTIGKLM